MRDKKIDTSPRFFALDLERQLLPGTFEHALNHLLICDRQGVIGREMFAIDGVKLPNHCIHATQ